MSREKLFISVLVLLFPGWSFSMESNKALDKIAQIEEMIKKAEMPSKDSNQHLESQKRVAELTEEVKKVLVSLDEKSKVLKSLESKHEQLLKIQKNLITNDKLQSIKSMHKRKLDSKIAALEGKLKENNEKKQIIQNHNNIKSFMKTVCKTDESQKYFANKSEDNIKQILLEKIDAKQKKIEKDIRETQNEFDYYYENIKNEISDDLSNINMQIEQSKAILNSFDDSLEREYHQHDALFAKLNQEINQREELQNKLNEATEKNSGLLLNKAQSVPDAAKILYVTGNIDSKTYNDLKPTITESLIVPTVKESVVAFSGNLGKGVGEGAGKLIQEVGQVLVIPAAQIVADAIYGTPVEKELNLRGVSSQAISKFISELKESIKSSERAIKECDKQLAREDLDTETKIYYEQTKKSYQITLFNAQNKLARAMDKEIDNFNFYLEITEKNTQKGLFGTFSDWWNKPKSVNTTVKETPTNPLNKK